MKRVPLVVALVLAWLSIVAEPVRPQTPAAITPPAVATLLARARAALASGKQVQSILSLAVEGTRTRSLDTRPTTDPYEFKLLLPDSLQWRSGAVLHTLTRGTFWQRPRFDEGTKTIAERSIRSNLLKVCLTYLACTPPAMATTAEDRGVQDYGWVRGRTISIYSPVDRLRVEFVIDEETAQPLATVTHGTLHNADGSSIANDLVGVFQDYREVGGVRLPYRIEERSKTDHALVVLTHVVANTLGPNDFVDKTTYPLR